MSSVLGEKISLVHCFVNSSSTEAGGVVNKSVCTSVCDNMYVVAVVLSEKGGWDYEMG